ncbi:hypothetical protein M9458_006706, partial [Cirrhinus mrigala]
MDPFDPLACPGYLLLLLEQGERSPEGHTILFLALAYLTSYLDDTLSEFYDASLNPACRALSSEDGSGVDFAVFVEWILTRNGSPFTVCFQSPAHLLPCCVDHKPEPTVDKEPELTVTDEPELTVTDESSPHGVTEQRIVAEPELRLQRPPRGIKLGAPPTAPWLRWRGLICRLLPPLSEPPVSLVLAIEAVYELSAILEIPEAHKFQPSLPLLPHPPLLSGSPVLTLSPPSVWWAHRCSASLHRRCGWSVQDSASARRPARSTMAPSSLLSSVARQSTGSARLPRPSGFALVCIRPSFDSTPLAAPRPSVSLASSGSSIPSAPPSSSVLTSTSALWILLVTLTHWLSVFASVFSATCSDAFGRPPGVISPSSSMAPLSVGSSM